MKRDGLLDEDIVEVLIKEKVLNERIKEMGKEITAAYEGVDEIVVVCILRGAVIFMADLSRQLELNVVFDFMDVSSYGQTMTSSGVVRILKDLEENIEGCHVLIIEDIIDTGITLKQVIEMLKTRNPASIKIVTLLDKSDRRVEKKVNVDFNGFEIPDKFVVVYGLDYAEKYRNLPYIGVLKEELYS